MYIMIAEGHAGPHVDAPFESNWNSQTMAFSAIRREDHPSSSKLCQQMSAGVLSPTPVVMPHTQDRSIQPKMLCQMGRSHLWQRLCASGARRAAGRNAAR